MATTRLRGAPGLLVFSAFFAACGYSPLEWEQRTREMEQVRGELEAEKKAHAQCEADHDLAVQEIEEQRRQLRLSGMDLEDLSTDLQEHRIAVDEYRHRSVQLATLDASLIRLRQALVSQDPSVVQVGVRRGLLVVTISADALFGEWGARVTESGQRVLLSVAEALRGDPTLSARAFQVRAHVDGRPIRGAVRDPVAFTAQRASAVLSALVTPVSDGGGGLSGSLWSAAGYGSSDRLVEGPAITATAESPADRRVELVLMPAADEVLPITGATTPAAPSPDAAPPAASAAPPAPPAASSAPTIGGAPALR